jgi:hypothetical protein
VGGGAQAARAQRSADTRGLLSGAYVTDGSALYCVGRVYVDRRSGGQFLELENCATMELSVWSGDELTDRMLRCVTPLDGAALAELIFASELGRPLHGLAAERRGPMTE